MKEQSWSQSIKKWVSLRVGISIKTDLIDLLALVVSSLFLISLDWFSQGVYTLWFGSDDPPHTTLGSILTLGSVSGSGVLSRVPVTPFGVAIAVIAVYLIALYLLTMRHGSELEQHDAKGGKVSQSDEHLMHARGGRLLLTTVSLVLFAIAISWLADSISSMFDRLDEGHLSFLSMLVFNILGILQVLALISVRNGLGNRIAGSLGLVLSLLCACGLFVLVCYPQTTPVRLGISTCLLVSYGNLFVCLVRYYSSPRNLYPPAPPPPHEHLVLLPSNITVPLMPISESNQMTAEKFMELEAFADFPEEVRGKIRSLFTDWKQTFGQSVFPPENELNKAILRILAFYTKALGYKQEVKSDLNPCSTEQRAIRLETNWIAKISLPKPEQIKLGSFAAELLCLGIMSKLFEDFVFDDGVKVFPLSKLAGLMTRMEIGKIRNYRMPLVAIEHHAKIRMPVSGQGKKLRTVTLLFSQNSSEPVEKELTIESADGSTTTTETGSSSGSGIGSLTHAKGFLYLFEHILKSYYPSLDHVNFYTYAPANTRTNAETSASTGRDPAQDGSGNDRPIFLLKEAFSSCNHQSIVNYGIDTENYQETLKAILDVINNGGHPPGETILDITSSQKTTSIASAAATVTTDAKVQYVNTHDYSITGFDIRVNQLKYLGS